MPIKPKKDSVESDQVSDVLEAMQGYQFMNEQEKERAFVYIQGYRACEIAQKARGTQELHGA